MELGVAPDDGVKSDVRDGLGGLVPSGRMNRLDRRRARDGHGDVPFESWTEAFSNKVCGRDERVWKPPEAGVER